MQRMLLPVIAVVNEVGTTTGSTCRFVASVALASMVNISTVRNLGGGSLKRHR